MEGFFNKLAPYGNRVWILGQKAEVAARAVMGLRSWGVGSCEEGERAAGPLSVIVGSLEKVADEVRDGSLVEVIFAASLGLVVFEPKAFLATGSNAAISAGYLRWIEIPRDDDTFCDFLEEDDRRPRSAHTTAWGAGLRPLPLSRGRTEGSALSKRKPHLSPDEQFWAELYLERLRAQQDAALVKWHTEILRRRQPRLGPESVPGAS